MAKKESRNQSEQGGRGKSSGGSSQRRSGNGEASVAEIQEHLSGIDYPVGKRDLIRHAEQQNAPQDVMSVLEQLPDQEYDSPVAVSKAVGKIE